MATKIQVSKHDFKLRSCLDYAHHSWNLHRKPKTVEIEPVTDFFRGRCARLRSLMQMPAQVGNVTMKLRDTYMRAIFDVTGGLDEDKLTDELMRKVDLRSNEIFAKFVEERLRQQKGANWDDIVHQNLISGLVAVELMGADPPTMGMFQASLMSYVTTCWGIIEIMSGDLWVVALNIHPSSLANLSGSPKRLKGGKINRPSQAAKESKSISLDEISKHGFDVANKMGTILRNKFDFASLEGIREAYACAFTNSAQIDRALTDASLDALSAVRNVIVHRDAQADSEYVKRTKYLSSIPRAEIGDHIMLDGDIVVRLLKPAISAANQLLIAVDDWLAKSSI